MRLIVLSRHAESEKNVQKRVNGDPSRPVALTERGVTEAERLGVQLANVRIDQCLHTRFDRTRRTAELALDGRGIPFRVEPLFDDLKLGELEGYTVDAFRDWKRGRSRDDPFPGGESLNDAARRYAVAFERVLGLEGNVLVVAHEIPLRYILNAARGSDELDAPVRYIPNSRPYLFGEEELRNAVLRLKSLVGS